MLHALLIVLHILICFALSTVILLQASKGGGLAGAFGGAGGAPQQLLGSRGMTTLLHKATIYLAVGFFMTSFLLFMTQGTGGGGRTSSVVGEAAQKGQLDVPVQQENPLSSDVPADAGGDQQSSGQQSTDDQGGGGQ